MLIGQHGVITTEQARDIAISMLAKTKDGLDLCAEKTSRKLEPLINEVAIRFINEHATIHCKASTTKEYQFCLNRYILPHLKHFKISDVNKSHIAQLQHTLPTKHSKDAANRSLRLISKTFNLAETWGLRKEGCNPCRGIKKFHLKPKQRFMRLEEFQHLGKVLNEIKNYPDENLAAVYCILLLALTGCRLSEIRTLKWDYINFGKQELRLPDSKTGAKTIYAGETVMTVLEEIKQHPARPKDNPYVIWGKNHGSCLNNIQKPWRRFRKLANLDDVRIHDLRHSFASLAINRGMSLAMVGKLLGRAQTQTTECYAHLMPDTIHDAANIITSEIKSLFNLDSAAKTSSEKTEKTNTVTGTSIQAPVYLTSLQAAEYLNVKQSLMEDWRYRKTGPAFIKVGSRVRYALEDLQSFLKASKHVAGI